MQNMKEIFQKTYFYHVLAWLSVGLMIFGLSTPSALIPLTLFISIMGGAYVGLFLHSYFFEGKKPVVFFAMLFVTPLLFAHIFEMIVSSLGMELLMGYFQNYMNFLLVMGVAIGLRYLKRGTIDHLLLQEAREKLLESELENLKSQLHPHFLFNTLNNMYALNLKDAERGSEMILALSDLLRYQLETQRKQKVSIQQEIEFIENYLSLERLRLTKDNEIEFKVNVRNPALKIAPSLFMPFIENAVKYGVMAGSVSQITMELEQKENVISFRAENPIFKDKKVVSTGKGLDNIKRRLELLYPGKHRLEIRNNGEQFVVALEVSL